MTPFIAEIIGTMFLIIMGNGVVANVVLKQTKGNNSGWIVIATGWGLAVFTGVVIAAPYSGAHINPAVTLGLAFTGKFAWSLVPMFIAAQFIGAMTGAIIVYFIYKSHFDSTPEPESKIAAFCTSPAIRHRMNNMFSELIGTFVLMFVIFYFTNPEIGEAKTPVGLGSLGAIPVALLVFAIGLSLGGTTGYAINPARDLGPRIVHALVPMKGKSHSDWNYAWVPVVGPVMGAGLAAFLFMLLQ